MSQKSYDDSASLYLIPTPIGNMEDLTYRSVETLKMVDVIFCEDTRETGKLLKYLDISKKMVRSDDHIEEKNKELIIEYLSQGLNVGLVSDRGTPIISDPGFNLSQYVIEKGYNVIGLPGANALIPALIMSGLNPKSFMFYGFLNSKKSQRIKELKELENEKATMIFYEAPHRINETLEDMLSVFGKDRKMSISREITKKFEEVYRGTIWEIMEEHNEYKGELVICVEGNTDTKLFEISIIDHINFYVNDGYSQMDAIKAVVKERNLKKSDVYNEYMKSQGK